MHHNQKRLRKRCLGLLCLFFCHASAFSNTTAKAPESTTPIDQRSRQTQAKLLGWEHTPLTDLPLCAGHFPTMPSHTHASSSLADAPITITSPHHLILKRDGTSTIAGGVTISQPDRTIKADSARIERQNHVVTRIVLLGNVRMEEPGRLLLASRIEVIPKTHTGRAMHVLYRIQKSRSQALAGWGSSQKIKVINAKTMTIYGGNYSTCPPDQTGWQMHSKHFVLNQSTGRGQAWNAWLSIGRLPIFYFPYLNFPIDHRRKSGFLLPSYTHNNTNGNTISLPIYWNIAPQYDAKLTPRWIEKRGVLYDVLYRHLNHAGGGNLHFQWLPQDRLFKNFKQQAPTTYANTADKNHYLNDLAKTSINRWYLQAHNTQQWHKSLHTELLLNYTNDPYFFQDLPFSTFTESTSQLPNHLNLNYQAHHINADLGISGYQTLHTINRQVLTEPYWELPALNVNASLPLTSIPFQLALSAGTTRFTKAADYVTNVSPVEGLRSYVEPTVSRTLSHYPIALTAAAALNSTFYQLKNQNTALKANTQRHTPIFSLDAQTQLTRPLSLYHHSYQQILEPRLMYLYVPYKNQNKLPDFDSDLPPFGTDMLFSTNRFTGQDRLGDANQLSFGLTTRLLTAQDRNEKLSAKVGGIYYLSNRQVCLNSNCDHANERLREEHFSPLSASIEFTPTPTWDLNADLAFEPAKHEAENGHAKFSYHKDDFHLFSVDYEFVRGGDPYPVSTVASDSKKQDLYRIKTALYWPMRQRLQLIGHWHYNLSHRFLESYFLGTEYRSCCWAIRMLVNRKLIVEQRDATQRYDKQIMLQLALKGLSTVGFHNPQSLLSSNIENFKDHLGDDQ